MKRKREKQRRKMMWWYTDNFSDTVLHNDYPAWVRRLMGWWT